MSDNLNDMPEEEVKNLTRTQKIKAIKYSVKISSNDWDDERSAMFSDKVHKVMDNRQPTDEPVSGVLDDMPEDSVPSEEIYEGLGFSDFREIIPDSDIPLFDADGVPLNDEGRQRSESENAKSDSFVSQPENDDFSAEDTHIYEKKSVVQEIIQADRTAETENPSEARAVSLVKKHDAAYNEPDIDDVPKKKKKKQKKPLKERFLGLFPQTGDKPLECVRKIVFLASIIAIIVCGYLIIDYYTDLWHSKNVNDEIMEIYGEYPDNRQEDTVEETEQKYYELLEGAAQLLSINSEVIGVIHIPDTPINNPVMKTKDNSKYLNVKINGDDSRAGEIFLDFRNVFDHVVDHKLAEPNSDNLIIYGHNMGNREMFGCLREYKDVDGFYEKHPVIYLNSNYECYTYKIFSIFMLDADDKSETKFDCWNNLDFSDEYDFYKFVNEAKRRNIRLNDVDVKYGDPLLTLSTCNSELGDRGRLIVMARRVRDGEDPVEGTQNSVLNPNIKWPSFYNSITGAKYDENAEFIPYGPEKKGATNEEK